MINQAERRIFISSLYIGSEEGELVSIDHLVKVAIHHFVSRYQR